MLEQLIIWDQAAFEWINSGWANGFLDSVAPWWRDKYTWIPLYAILLIGLVWRFRWRSLPYIGLLLLIVGSSDFVSSSIIKPWIERLRPCQDPEMADRIRVLINCGVGKSFTSSHATNHFALAVGLSLGLGRVYRWIIPVFLIWAVTVSLAQVYVGVHYPLDILGGAILGTLIATVWFWVYRKWVPNPIFTRP